jgi:hypothetical protein
MRAQGRFGRGLSLLLLVGLVSVCARSNVVQTRGSHLPTSASVPSASATVFVSGIGG